MKKWLLGVAIFVGFGLGYGAVSLAYPSGGMYGRGAHIGYFQGGYDDVGDRIWKGIYQNNEAIPSYVDTAQEFIDFVKSKLNTSWWLQDSVGASFLIQTMTNYPTNTNAPRDHVPTPTAAQIADWEARVRYAESQGWITWRTNFSYSINSYYQGCCGGAEYNDDAFYDNSNTAPAIIFRNSTGAVVYAVKWLCANPVGNVTGLQPNWTATGRSVITVNPNPRPGEQVTFEHYVKNNGPSAAPDIWSLVRDDPSNTDLTTGQDDGAYTIGQEKLVKTHVRTVPLTALPGDQICEKVYFSPGQSTSLAGGTGPPVCAIVGGNFTATPIVDVQVNGAVANGNEAEPGDTVSFIYSVKNVGAPTPAITCTYKQASYAGYNTTAPTTGFTPAGANCAPSRTFPGDATTTIATEVTVPAGGNTSLCRSLTITPITQSGGTQTAQGCAFIIARPYARVFGGDVVAGGGVMTAPNVCGTNANAAIIGWNKRNASYDGAGVQFAAYALSTIFDTASSFANGAGSVATPVGLSFANTVTDAVNGNFGGSFGSVPCIPDHYATLPSGSTSLGAATSASLADGSYSRMGGDLQLSAGTINPGNRVSIYVDGNLYITGNVTFGGSGTWTNSTIPMVRVVARGDIFIDKSVTQLDGLYVAQPRSDGSKGTIYTCATSATPLSPSGTLGSTCNTKLTINGAFVARQVQLLRTNGTLRQSSAGEGSGSGNIAEVFNYNPAVWMVQPPNAATSSAEYDAINSLPPVL